MEALYSLTLCFTLTVLNVLLYHVLSLSLTHTHHTHVLNSIAMMWKSVPCLVVLNLSDAQMQYVPSYTLCACIWFQHRYIIPKLMATCWHSTLFCLYKYMINVGVWLTRLACNGIHGVSKILLCANCIHVLNVRLLCMARLLLLLIVIVARQMFGSVSHVCLCC